MFPPQHAERIAIPRKLGQTSGGRWNVILKRNDESQNNTNGGTTLRADAELRVPIVAGSRYRVQARVFGGAIFNGTPDIKTTWLHLNTAGVIIPSAFSFFLAQYYATPNANTLSIISPTLGTPTPHTALPASKQENTSASGIASEAEFDYILWDVVAEPTQSGFLAFAWAQQTASVFFSIVGKGSSVQWIGY